MVPVRVPDCAAAAGAGAGATPFAAGGAVLAAGADMAIRSRLGRRCSPGTAGFAVAMGWLPCRHSAIAVTPASPPAAPASPASPATIV